MFWTITLEMDSDFSSILQNVVQSEGTVFVPFQLPKNVQAHISA